MEIGVIQITSHDGRWGPLKAGCSGLLAGLTKNEYERFVGVKTLFGKKLPSLERITVCMEKMATQTLRFVKEVYTEYFMNVFIDPSSSSSVKYICHRGHSSVES